LRGALLSKKPGPDGVSLPPCGSSVTVNDEMLDTSGASAYNTTGDVSRRNEHAALTTLGSSCAFSQS